MFGDRVSKGGDYGGRLSFYNSQYWNILTSMAHLQNRWTGDVYNPFPVKRVTVRWQLRSVESAFQSHPTEAAPLQQRRPPSILLRTLCLCHIQSSLPHSGAHTETWMSVAVWGSRVQVMWLGLLAGAHSVERRKWSSSLSDRPATLCQYARNVR